MDLEDFGRQLRGHVLSGTGLTIGVGFGATKHWPNRRSGRQRNGHNSGGTGAVARKSTQNGKITQPAAGGRNLGRGEPDSEKLHVMGITTALQLSLTNPTFIRKNFNVVLERTVRELNGELHFTGGSAAAETADCLQSQLRAADHHLRRNAPSRLPVCRARGGKVAR